MPNSYRNSNVLLEMLCSVMLKESIISLRIYINTLVYEKKKPTGFLNERVEHLACISVSVVVF